MLALHSLWNRKMTVALTILGIAVSSALIVAVDRVRIETRTSFTQTIAGTDLVVGARTSPVQLLLYTVFRIGDPTNSIRWSSFEKISAHPKVAWAVPLSLGDSHRGFRVLGTSVAYFEHLRYGDDRPLVLAQGKPFDGVFDAVIGAEVAQTLGYRVGDPIVVAHGARDDGLSRHDDHPFSVSGILKATGTPVDQTVHVTLAGIEAIHVGWEGGVRPSASMEGAELVPAALQPNTITAFLLGLDRKMDVFLLQRAINQFRDEPLLAILPGVALQSLWDLFGTAESALVIVTGLTMVTGVIGMVVGVLATLNERRREMAVLRTVGARPTDIFGLFLLESSFVAIAGVVLGFLILTVALFFLGGLFEEHFGILPGVGLPSGREVVLLAVLAFFGGVAGLIPALQAYRLSVHDGLHAGA